MCGSGSELALRTHQREPDKRAAGIDNRLVQSATHHKFSHPGREIMSRQNLEWHIMCAKLYHGIWRSEAIFLGIAVSSIGMHISIVPNSLHEIRATIQGTI